MRSSIRLAVPAVAAAMLLLGACGGDDEDGEGGALGIGEQPEEEQQPEGEAETGGEEGGDAGAEGGAAPTAEELEGMWSTGLEDADAVLTFTSGSVTFMESTGADMSGAYCLGTVSGASMSLECDNGSTDWSEGTLALNGSELNVTWASGTSETYTSLSDISGLEDMPDLGDLGGLGEEELAELEDLEQELEDLGY
ncbi:MULTISPECIES: hypothetical protein [Streptomyces]|uniref:hypothetical protein n=1 Tax=Streptomyces TaxID=1883 RepID=UPI00186B2128|nr:MULTISPECIES: hypothetical protein [Streptomyces]